MSTSRQFAMMARNSAPTVVDDTPRILMDGRMTIMKLCRTCGQQMPHVVGSLKCVLCELDNDSPAPQPQNQDSG